MQGILGMDFSPDGYHLASCAEDNTCRIWDLRKRACIYTIPGHKSLVSQVGQPAALLGHPCCFSSGSALTCCVQTAPAVHLCGYPAPAVVLRPN